MHPAERHPDIANLRVFDVYGAALRLYRREPVRVGGAALVLLGPPVFLGIGSGRLVDSLREDVLDDRIVIALAIAVIAGVLASIGTIVYAGVLEELVGSVIRHDRRPTIVEAVRALPILRLIGADVAATALVGLTSALGAIPGFVTLAMLGIVGPVVNIERARPLVAITRSVRLTSRHLALTLICVGLPLLIEGAVHHWLLHVRHESDVLIELAVSIPVVLTIGAFVGLTEVELAYALLARDEGSSFAGSVGATAGGGSDYSSMD